MSVITTHVLDMARGCPAAGMTVVLEQRLGSDRWQRIGAGETDADGRLRSLVAPDARLRPGVYRLVFDTERYFAADETPAFFPEVIVMFETVAGDAHYHVPLLLSPFGYSTYRGT